MKTESDHTNQLPELPSPEAETSNSAIELAQTGVVSQKEITSAKAIEKGMSASPAVADPGGSLPASQGQASTTSLSDDLSLAGTGTIPPIADDGDLIEKEWVEKAKDIVNRTKHDPYTQNKEMNQVKADYLKIRYNKEVKLNED